MIPGTVFERISQEYYDLTAAEKKTADYVMQHPRESQFLSIAELAEESGVAEATISRFCRRLGYKGYNAFKLAIANATAGQQRKDKDTGPDGSDGLYRQLFAADVAAVSETLEMLRQEDLKAAAADLYAARKVLCMGQGGSMLMAEEAAHLFSTVSGKFFAVSDSHSQAIAAANLQKNDMLLFFSYSGSTRELIETLNISRERSAKVILITRFPRSPGAILADYVLPCGSKESPLQPSSVPAAFAQFFVLDALFAEYCLCNPAECSESRERVAAALTDKHL